MFKLIKKIKGRFGDSDFKVLCFEQILFSALYGIAFHSWVVFGVMFLGSFWLLNRSRGTMYMVYAMSILWGFVAFSIGHSISWGWAAALGASFFLLGIKAHLTGLKKPMAIKLVSVNPNNIEWRRNGYLGRQNLN